MKLKYNRELQTYNYKDWQIKKLGGHITIGRYNAENSKTGQWFWQFKLAEVKTTLERIETNPKAYNKLDKLYKKGLY